MNLKKHIIDGTRWMSFSSVLLLVGYFLVYGLLFHLVTPGDIAVFSLAQAVVSLALNILAPAFGNAIVAKRTLTDGQFSSVYWLNLILGLLLGLAVFGSGYWLEIIYQSDGLETAAYIISISLPLAAIGQPFKYLLQRGESFKVLSINRLVVFFSFALFAIWGSRLGYGAIALVWAFVFQTFIETVYMVWYGLRIRKPSLTLDREAILYFTKFGIYQGGERLVDTFASQVDTFLIGRILGMECLGVYEAVKRILIRPLNLANDAIEGVLFPVMAKRQQDSRLLAKLFLQNVKYLGLLCFLPYFLAVLLAQPLTEIFLGKSWPDSALIFGLFSLVMLIRVPRMPSDALVMAKGKPKWWFIWKCVQLTMTIACISFGLVWGIEGVLYFLVLLQLLLGVSNYFFLVKKLAPVYLMEYIKSIYPALFAALFSSMIGCMISMQINDAWGTILLGSCISGFVFVFWLFKFNKIETGNILELFKIK